MEGGKGNFLLLSWGHDNGHASPVVAVGAPVGTLAWSAPANSAALLCLWVPPAVSCLAHQLLLCLSPGSSAHWFLSSFTPSVQEVDQAGPTSLPPARG